MSGYPGDTRPAIADRDGWLCWRCGHNCRYGIGGNIQHRKNRSQGGGSAPSNRLVLCGNGTMGCHGWVTAHPRLAALAGWTVPSTADPALIEAWNEPRQGWYRLDDQYGLHRASHGDGPPVEALCR